MPSRPKSPYISVLLYTNMKQTLYDYCYVCDRHCGAPSFQAVAFAISLPGTLKLTRVTQQISKKIPHRFIES